MELVLACQVEMVHELFVILFFGLKESLTINDYVGANHSLIGGDFHIENQILFSTWLTS